MRIQVIYLTGNKKAELHYPNDVTEKDIELIRDMISTIIISDMSTSQEVIKFNPDNKERLSFGESCKPAMNITDPENAKQYLHDYVEYTVMMSGLAYKDARINCIHNLRYIAGYYDRQTELRVMELFK